MDRGDLQAFENMRISAYDGSLMGKLSFETWQVENLPHTPVCGCSKKLAVGCVKRFRDDTPAARPAPPIDRRLETGISTAGVSSPKRLDTPYSYGRAG
jgi:hypothetical protein